MHFIYTNIQLKKDKEENRLLMTGEVTNTSGKSYNTVVFRAALFIKNIPVGNVTFAVKGIRPKQLKTFSVRVGELDYKLIPEISRYEIYPESAY